MIRYTFGAQTERLRRISAKVDRSSSVLLFSCAVLCLGFTCVLASVKPFWNDELFTFYISRQKTMSDIWDVLETGAEQLPPLFFVITRAFTTLFGHSRLAFRLPEVIGFWIASINLFFFVKRRTSGAFALTAFLFPSLTGAFYYATEARPYSLVLCFCSVALLYWQAAAENQKRALALFGLGISLAACVGCHYYAVLAFSPFLLGECVRFYQRRQLDWIMYLAIAAGFLPLILFLPLIRAGMKYASVFWAKPQWTKLLNFYQDLLIPAAFVLFAMAIITSLRTKPETVSRSNGADNWRIPAHEIAVAVGLALIPWLAIFLAKFVTGAFTDRYAVTAVLGISILLAWSLARLAFRSTITAFTIFLVCLGWFCIGVIRTHKQSLYNAQERASTYQFLQSQMSSLRPVIITGPHLFFEMSYLTDLEKGRRPVYLADTSLALHYTGTDSVEKDLLDLRHYAPLDVRDFRDFCASHQEFLLYSSTFPFEWVTEELLRQQRKLTVKARRGADILFLVTSERP